VFGKTQAQSGSSWSDMSAFSSGTTTTNT